jgi:hypothetical protein
VASRHTTPQQVQAAGGEVKHAAALMSEALAIGVRAGSGWSGADHRLRRRSWFKHHQRVPLCGISGERFRTAGSPRSSPLPGTALPGRGG